MAHDWAYLVHIPEWLDRRADPRHVIRFRASAKRSANVGNPVLVTDISRSGMRLMTSEDLPIGVSVEIDLPEVGEIMGFVRWHEDVQYGLEFAEILSKAELAATRLVSQRREPHDHVEAVTDEPTKKFRFRERMPSLRLLIIYAALSGVMIIAIT